MTDHLSEVLERLKDNPRLAHEYLFEGRHENASPDFHFEFIDLWHSDLPKVQIEAFRGSGKSTRFEEGVTIGALFHAFDNAIIVGASEERACERLAAIKHEIENNERIHEVFGDLKGDKWGEKKIILANGVCIQAKGRGQSLRGTKHLNARPDILFLDDVEQDDEFMPTEENCRKVTGWLLAVAIPGMHPTRRRIRIAGTPGSPFSLTMQLRRAADWVTRRYPIVRKTEKGDEPTWGDRFSMAWVRAEKKSYADLGQSLLFEQEYMLNPTDPSAQPFKPEYLKVAPLTRTWEPTWSFHDPARTVTARSGKSSALTGKAVWSWIGTKLVVWEIWQKPLLPDEIVNDIFDTDSKWSPVHVGVEKNGLDEFIFQPLRSQMVARGHSIPIRSMQAPKSKIDFIKGLQPFAAAGELIFAQELPSDVKNAFLNVGVGSRAIDAPNALAYALLMRPGQPMYQTFTQGHIDVDLKVNAGLSSMHSPLWLAMNATQLCTTGVLLQFDNGALRILADWVTEDPPAVAFRHIVQLANLTAGGKVKIGAGAEHFSDYDNVGLRIAAGKAGVEIQKLGVAHNGREELRALFARQVGGKLLVRVSPSATWTLRALSGGYARTHDKRGQLEEFAIDGSYKVLMEGLESLLALTNLTDGEETEQRNYATSRSGHRYLTALPGRTTPKQPLKGSF